MPPLVTRSAPDFVFGRFFSIFSGLLKIISVLGIRVLVSTKYLKTLYIYCIVNGEIRYNEYKKGFPG